MKQVWTTRRRRRVVRGTSARSPVAGSAGRERLRHVDHMSHLVRSERGGGGGEEHQGSGRSSTVRRTCERWTGPARSGDPDDGPFGSLVVCSAEWLKAVGRPWPGSGFIGAPANRAHLGLQTADHAGMKPEAPQMHMHQKLPSVVCSCWGLPIHDSRASERFTRPIAPAF